MPFAPTDTFARRHIGPREHEFADMLAAIGCDSFEQLIDRAVPQAIRYDGDLNAVCGEAMGETEALAKLGEMMSANRVLKSFIGLGYHGTHVPPVIQRNVLENPGWYTQYTP